MRKSMYFAAASLLAATSSVWAAEESLELEEIVVTAQKVSQSIQDVPLSITALSGAALAEKGIDSIAAIEGKVPGVTLASVGNGINVQIRGIGNTSALTGAESTVSISVDGVYRARNFSTAIGMFDVARVEVLRGPQGTLYGRNATVGAVNIVSNKPSNKDEASATVEVGNFNLTRFQGVVNVPVSDTFMVRAAGQLTKRDGYLQPSGKNDQDDMGARFRTLWTPSEDLSLMSTFDYSHKGGQGASVVVLPQFASVAGNVNREFYRNDSVNNPSGNEWFNNWDPDTIDMREWGVALDLDYNLGWSDLYVQPAYRGFYLVNYGPQFGVPIGGYQKNEAKQSSLEVRLSSKPDDFIKWIGGLYYFNEKFDYAELRSETAVPSAFPAIAVGPNGEDRFRSSTVQEPNSTAYAAFGQVTVPVTDWFRVTAGGRYTKDERENDTIQYGYYWFSSNGVDEYVAPTGSYLHSSKSFSHTDWKLGIEVDAGANTLLYAGASTGYKAGGLNGLVQASAPATSPRSYEAEELTEYMAGIKNTFMDGRLIVNAQGFQWDYKGRQQALRSAVNNTGTLFFINYNIGSAKISGAELEVYWRPTDVDTVGLQTAYTYGKYDDSISNFLAAPAGGADDFRNRRIPFQAPLQVVLDLEHRFNFGSGASLAVSYNGTWRDERYVETALRVKQEADLKHNLTLSYKAASDKFGVMLWGRNLTNEAVVLNSNTPNTPLNAFFTQFAQVANMEPPRTYGVTANLKF